MKYYLGIDPGKSGGMAIIDENSQIVETMPTPLIGSEYDRQEIKSIFKSREFHKVCLEKPNIIFGVGKSAVASLMNCVGLFEGILLGADIPYILVQPKEWQKECWKHVKVQKNTNGKGNDTKATSLLAAQNLWSNENFKITPSGKVGTKVHDGIVDAVLLAEYSRRLFR